MPHGLPKVGDAQLFEFVLLAVKLVVLIDLAFRSGHFTILLKVTLNPCVGLHHLGVRLFPKRVVYFSVVRKGLVIPALFIFFVQCLN